MQIAGDLGMDVDQLKIDMEAPEVDAHIQASHALTRSLGLNGTPAFVFGEQLVPGAIDLNTMKAMVDEMRG